MPRQREKTTSEVNDKTSEQGSPVLGQVDRRRVLRGGLAVAAGMAGAGAIGASTGAAAPAASFSAAAPLAQELPADAAAAEQQIWRQPADATIAKVLDFYEQVYERPTPADLFSDPLVRLTKNFEIEPAAALEWSGSEDGKTWTFRLDPNLVWSDGNPVTANDWVRTFQYAADPEHAWDFTWFWNPVIRGFAEATEGTASPEEIGVTQGANPQELIFETVDPAPYLPSMLLYSLPLSAAALDTHGPLYNTKPETAVSSGPFILAEWQRDQFVAYERNETYAGSLQVPIQRVVSKLATPTAYFTMYEAGEVDFMENPAPAELKLMEADPERAKEIYQGVGDFRIDYLFFDVTKAPFDDLKVRQAFSHVVDRDAIKQQILGAQGNQAYSYLAPGFPASNMDAYKDVRRFDPEAGKQLLAEAGFPDGEGFPQLELWLRAPTPVDSAVGGAVASMLKEHLNIDVEVSAKDQKLFTDSMNAKPTEIPFGFVSYGMDYLDPSNMLGVWLSGGRHPWNNPDFDAKVKEATTFLGDAAERLRMFQDAERILVEDVPAVFVYYRTPVQLIKPYVKGDALEPDDNGVVSIHWPSYTTMSTVPAGLYIGEEAPPDRT